MPKYFNMSYETQGCLLSNGVTSQVTRDNMTKNTNILFIFVISTASLFAFFLFEENPMKELELPKRLFYKVKIKVLG